MKRVLWLFCVVAQLAVVCNGRAQSFFIDRFIISGGSGESSGAAYLVSGTIGQPAGGVSSGGAYTLEGGVWPGFVVAIQTPGAPTLALTRSGGNVALTWSSAASFVLEETSSLRSPINWQPVGQAPVVTGSDYTVTLPTPASPRFYRLRFP
jgi:hypothetical protein